MAIHILVLLLGQTLLINWRWIGVMAHTGVEISGAIIAFFVAMFLLRDERFGRGSHYNIPIAAALLAMGIFDTCHALVAVGDTFVWLHSLASFAGGVLFVFICAPKHWHFINSHPWWQLSSLLACLIALTSVIHPELIPAMVLDDKFTGWAIFLNLFGGCLLFICAIKLVLSYLATKNVDDLLFCLHCFLFGAAAIMFQQSSLWDAPWWGWHFLRFMAYVFALWFVIRSELRAFDELDNHRHALELAVNERTQQLQQANEGLQITLEQMAQTRDQLVKKEKQATLAQLTTQKSLDELTLAKDSLVQAEKMASLGQLVVGVAHEVNTPLGVCVTSNSAIKDNILVLSTAIESEKLTRQQLRKNLVSLLEYQEIIERSLNKAGNLIQSFKSLAVEQDTDPEVEINLSAYLHSVINVVKTVFKSKNYHIDLSIDDSLNLITYPSAWNQILTNLLMNSHIHGFQERQQGDISIVVRESYGYLTLDYEDNGKGVAQEIKHHIFDPFVTTKRGQGSSGLGMNIVFNLVSCKLAGTIKCLECEQGCHFKIELPVLYPEL
ncbi:ATP-binding protein [Thalassomonas sp. RHCl1]|uniref:ATP-binding protein n=1 Tax=Thalassomonas sp. RHCl1 TaxID=2995320 RepID=UPI00248C6889|nr:ATP-binding protein [Thalassomonas sp. RHCl1]